MTYFPKTTVTFQDTNVDAFSRFRSSEPFTLFDSKQLYDTGSLFWDFSGSGGGFNQYTSSRASSILTVLANPSSSFVRQTRQRFNYQPGKSQQISLTSVFGSGSAGLVKRAGYFDQNNGVFLNRVHLHSMWDYEVV